MSDVVLKTIIAEAGGDPAAMAAVASVIHNRAVAEGKTPEQIVKARGQFEGYSNPGPASVRAQNDPNVVARASQVWDGVKSGTIADPTNGGTFYHADYVTPYWAKSANQHGTVNIGGNIFYKGSGSPQTALAAINDVAPTPQPRPAPTEAYAAPQPVTPSVRVISVNPNGTPVQPQMQLPQDAMYGINRLNPGQVTHAPNDFTTQDSGSPIDGRLSALLAPAQFQQSQPSAPLVSRPVQTVSINPETGNPYTGQELAQVAANREAARLRGDVGSGQVASIAAPQPIAPRTNTPAPAKVTFTGNGMNSPPTAFQQGNQQIAQSILNNLPFGIGTAATGIGDAYNAAANLIAPKASAQPQTGTMSASGSGVAGTGASGSASPVMRSIQVANPAYAKWAADQQMAPGVDFIGEGPGDFANFSNVMGLTKAPIVVPRPVTAAPPKYITQTVRVPTVSRPSGGILSTVAPATAAPAPGVISPAVHAALMAQQSPDQRGQAALQASGMIDNFGMVTGSNEKGQWH